MPLFGPVQPGGEGGVFRTRILQHPHGQSQLIAAWRELYGKEVSGHLARRTGALTYVRKGWPLAQIAYLGRWKSSIIYQYSEEALQSIPVNREELRGAAPQKEKEPSQHKKDLEALKARVSEQLEKFYTGAKGLEELRAEVQSIKKAARPSGGLLPRNIQSSATRVVHANMNMSACSPPQSWRTRCGWQFYGSRAVFLGEEAAVTCAKCIGLTSTVAQSKEVEGSDRVAICDGGNKEALVA